MTSAARDASHPSWLGWPGRTIGQVPPGWSVPVVDPDVAYRQALRAGLIVHRADPLNAETPLSAFTGTLVPRGRHYVRNHFRSPRLDAATWRLRVGGLAGRR